MFSAGFLIGTAIVGIVATLPYIGRLADKNTLGSEMERYIISRNPQNAADIDRLQHEYVNEQARNRIL